MITTLYNNLHKKSNEVVQMTVEAYKKYICPNCKNKDKYLCNIRYRYDNTLYCTGYDSNIEKRKTNIKLV